MYSRCKFKKTFTKSFTECHFNHPSLDKGSELVTSVGGLQCFDVNFL